MKRLLRKNEKGFTLLEVMLVVIIIAIIAIIALPRLLVTRVTAAEGSCDSNLQAIRTQLEQFHWNEGYFPADLATFVANTAYFPAGTQVSIVCPLNADPTQPAGVPGDLDEYTYAIAPGADGVVGTAATPGPGADDSASVTCATNHPNN